MNTQKKTPAGEAGVQLYQHGENVPNERYGVIV